MSDTVVGLSLVAEIGVMIGLVLAYDPSDYIRSKRTAQDDWYTRLDSAFATAGGQNLILNSQYTKSLAVSDVSSISDSILETYGNTNPTIFATQCTSTGYNSTALSAISGSLGNSVESSGAKYTLQNILNYQQISQNNIAAYVALLAVGKNTSAVVTVSSNPYGANLTTTINDVYTGTTSYAGDVSAQYSAQQQQQLLSVKSMNMSNNYSTSFDANFGD